MAPLLHRATITTSRHWTSTHYRVNWPSMGELLHLAQHNSGVVMFRLTNVPFRNHIITERNAQFTVKRQCTVFSCDAVSNWSRKSPTSLGTLLEHVFCRPDALPVSQPTVQSSPSTDRVCGGGGGREGHHSVVTSFRDPPTNSSCLGRRSPSK